MNTEEYEYELRAWIRHTPDSRVARLVARLLEELARVREELAQERAHERELSY